MANNFFQTVRINGLHCPACLKLVPLRLQEIQGVTKVKIKDLNGETTITANEPIEPRQIVAALAGTPYKVTSIQE